MNYRKSLIEKLAAIDDFAARMKVRIREEEAAGRDEWDTYSLPQLHIRCIEQLCEFTSAIAEPDIPSESLVEYLVDAANYLAITADVIQSRGIADLDSLRQRSGGC